MALDAIAVEAVEAVEALEGAFATIASDCWISSGAAQLTGTAGALKESTGPTSAEVYDLLGGGSTALMICS